MQLALSIESQLSMPLVSSQIGTTTLEQQLEAITTVRSAGRNPQQGTLKLLQERRVVDRSEEIQTQSRGSIFRQNSSRIRKEIKEYIVHMDLTPEDSISQLTSRLSLRTTLCRVSMIITLGTLSSNWRKLCYKRMIQTCQDSVSLRLTMTLLYK